MKTDQLMTVNFKHGNLQIFHNSHMGKLSDAFDIGNKYRVINGKPLLYMIPWLKMTQVQEYMALVEKEVGSPVKITKTGKNGGTWVHLYILLDAAMYLSAEFKLDVIKTFVEGKLLINRNDSGDEFIKLNGVVADNAQALFGKPAHSGHFVGMAKILRDRILQSEGHQGWNYATSAELTERVRIENAVSKLIEHGLVKDWEHLKVLLATF